MLHFLTCSWIVFQVANEAPASDKPFQCFGFTSDDAYTQGISVDGVTCVLQIQDIVLKVLQFCYKM